MVDTTWTTMHVGGALPAGKIAAFLDAIESDFSYEAQEAPTSEEDIQTIVAKGESALMQAHCIGNPDDVIDFCKANDLTFWVHYDYGNEWDSYIEIWAPGMDRPEETPASAQGYSPLVSLATLQMRAEKNIGLPSVIEEIARFESHKVPPLTITAETVADAATEEASS